MLQLCYQNILESATVTLSVGTENSSYPLYRLSDRNIGLMFMPTAAVTIEVKIDQGTSPIAVDRLLIPDGHNLNSMTLDIKYSTDDATYTPAVAQWSGVSGLINMSWTSQTKRYWKFIITSPGIIPQFAELFLGWTYIWERNPARPTGAMEPVFNVERRVTASGQPRYCVHGSPKRQRIYPVTPAGDTQKTNFLLFYNLWAGCKPFWLCDQDGVWIFGELLSPPNMTENSGGQKYPFKFDFLEVLPT